MIIPQNRLLWIFSCTVLPVSLVAAASPDLQGALGIAAALILFISIIDALTMMGRVDGIQLVFPGALHVGRDRPETVRFSVRDAAGKIRQIKLALELPCGVTSEQQALAMPLKVPDAATEGQWPIVGRSRGEYRIEACRVRIASRFGLWCTQKRVRLNTVMRVYPDINRSWKDMDAFLLAMNQAGRRAQRQIGQGRDFEKVRDYLPGDSMSDVHWRLTARRGHLVTKEFQIERTQDIYVLIDSSRLSGRPLATSHGEEGGKTEPLLERVIESTLALAGLAMRQGDRFGLVTFAGDIGNFLRARSGTGHFRMCRDTLLHLETQAVNPDFEELASFLVQNVRRRALLIFITSLDDPALAEAFTRSIVPVSARHLVLTTMVNPPAVQPLFSGGPVVETGQVYTALGGHLVWQELRELEINLRRQGVEFSLVHHDQLCPEVISQYLKVKKRQIL